MKKNLFLLVLSIYSVKAMDIEKKLPLAGTEKSNLTEAIRLARIHVPSLSNDLYDTFYVYYLKDGKKYYDFVQSSKDGSKPEIVHSTYEIAFRPS